MSKEYHVSVSGNDLNDGGIQNPFRTISKAAREAQAGDKVVVHEGTYREWVKPAHKGYSNINRITYEAAPGEKVIIKGSEVIKDWENVEGTVWKAVVPNTLFHDFNPFAEPLSGDWLIDPADRQVHAGDVYLNGKSLYEAYSMEDLKNPEKREDGFNAPWTLHREPLLDPEGSLLQWYAQVDQENTTIYANFQGADPTKELVEINVRPYCFYPERTGVNYITVRGFEMAQAASPWAPPTADQPGLLGAHWSKGWIIEDNIIHDAKCSAISLGKEISTGHNACTRRHRKPGYQYQMEAVFRARQIGWSKEKIGSHIVRNNVIYDCGQNGIVGHMGCVFSEIYGNEIYNIGVKHEFFGYEIAGIKLHAAIDVQIHNNNIHNCTLGTWLDWQAQGVRVSRNLYYANDRDFMIEVTHGPYMIDNNIFASDYNFDNVAQGGAYINNLCCGTMRRLDVLDRSTPYHFPHSTEVAGTAVVFSGDDRLYQNIFLGGAAAYTEESITGTSGYDVFELTSMKEYTNKIASSGNGDHEMFDTIKQPVYINGNAYLNGARPYRRETSNYVSDSDPAVKITQEGKETYLEITVEKGLLELPAKVINSGELEMVRIVEAAYEDPSGNSIAFDTDYLGEKYTEAPIVGSIQSLKEGSNRIKVWG